MEEGGEEDLSLPEWEFTYVAGTKDRPWEHFLGRWRAMRPHLNRMLATFDGDRPLRIVDVGSCTGFFSLQAAYRYPEADVVAVEGSIGIGNGVSGKQGNVRDIICTGAVQTCLRWIQRLQLPNCFVAPEVWDYCTVKALLKTRLPICDVTFLLSVLHHVDNASADQNQYAQEGMSRCEGTISLIGAILQLAPFHFIELPEKPWLADAYEVYHTQRAILEAAAKISGRQWNFKGPILTSEWFGLRELWVLEAKESMPQLDLTQCPFKVLCRGDDAEIIETPPNDVTCAGTNEISFALRANDGTESPLPDPLREIGRRSQALEPNKHPIGIDALATSLISCKGIGGSLLDPATMAGGDTTSVDPSVMLSVASAPTDLLLAHLNLREAMEDAQMVLSKFEFDQEAARARDMQATEARRLTQVQAQAQAQVPQPRMRAQALRKDSGGPPSYAGGVVAAGAVRMDGGAAWNANNTHMMGMADGGAAAQAPCARGAGLQRPTLPPRAQRAQEQSRIMQAAPQTQYLRHVDSGYPTQHSAGNLRNSVHSVVAQSWN